ncbi:hypothetical protein GCM10020331_033400 [Ectobacillus funiculus]
MQAAIPRFHFASNMNMRFQLIFRLVQPVEFITTLHHFTGSKDHNVKKMRQIAKAQNKKISEYGVENLETGEIVTFESEEDFFAHFWIVLYPA